MSATLQYHSRRTPAPSASAPSESASCANCRSRDRCIASGLAAAHIEQIDALAFARRRIHEGETLFHPGQPFRSIYAVHSGTFKNVVALGDGREQVTGFSMSGDLLGLEGLAAGAQPGAAIAIEDSEVCVIPFTELSRLARANADMHKLLSRLLGSAIVREHHAMVLLGSMGSDERIAAFLLDVSRKMQARGYSGSEFHMRMSRAEIGSYLGSTLETVSRALSAFQRQGMIHVDKKHVRILDADALHALGDRAFV